MERRSHHRPMPLHRRQNRQARFGQAGGQIPALEGFTAPKLLWMRDEEPDLYDQARALLMPKDYVRLALTGEKATEPSDAAGTLVVRRAAEPLVGRDDHRAATRRGDTPVCAGFKQRDRRTHRGRGGSAWPSTRHACSRGRRRQRRGSSGLRRCRAGRLGRPPSAPPARWWLPSDGPASILTWRIHSFNHALADTWYLMGVVLSAGAALEWFRRALVGPMGTPPGYEELTAEAASVPPGSDGLNVPAVSDRGTYTARGLECAWSLCGYAYRT